MGISFQQPLNTIHSIFRHLFCYLAAICAQQPQLCSDAQIAGMLPMGTAWWAAVWFLPLG